MGKADNVCVVRALNARGIFLIKGAVEAVACALKVPRYTIYNDLDQERRLGILTMYLSR
jgi:predicted transcriptional regulator YheO